MRSKNPAYFEALETFIDNYKSVHGKAPNTFEIADGTGMSKSNAARYLKHMREKGLLEYEGARGFITQRDKKASRRINGVPVLGDIACGLPLLAEQNIEEYVDLPESWVGAGQFFALHANGESMKDIGINSGDIVIIRQQETAEPGQVIVALVDESSATLKRYYPRLDDQVVELRPENDAFETQVIDLRERTFAIQGIAVKVLKDI
jgi:repressor LexA